MPCCARCCLEPSRKHGYLLKQPSSGLKRDEVHSFVHPARGGFKSDYEMRVRYLDCWNVVAEGSLLAMSEIVPQKARFKGFSGLSLPKSPLTK